MDLLKLLKVDLLEGRMLSLKNKEMLILNRMKELRNEYWLLKIDYNTTNPAVFYCIEEITVLPIQMQVEPYLTGSITVTTGVQDTNIIHQSYPVEVGACRVVEMPKKIMLFLFLQESYCKGILSRNKAYIESSNPFG